MATLKYYYQVDQTGNPIQGSNLALTRAPLQYGKGARWILFYPISQSFPCCESGPDVASTNHKWRYYIRISPLTNLPIPGSLLKAHFPPQGKFQEILPTYCCG